VDCAGEEPEQDLGRRGDPEDKKRAERAHMLCAVEAPEERGHGEARCGRPHYVHMD
jgi:hypothetical protein